MVSTPVRLGWPALLLSAVLVGCGALPPRGEQTDSHAITPSPDSPLARVAQASVPTADLSGFRLMTAGFYSLDARIELVRRARVSLDVQYYAVENDRTGRLLVRKSIEAGVKIVPLPGASSLMPASEKEKPSE